MSDSFVPAELNYRRLAEYLPNLVWSCRGDGPCDYLSPQWLEYTGRPVEEQLGYGWLDAVHPDDRSRTFERWSAAVESRGVLDTEFRIRRYDGAYRWFTTRAVPELDASGNIVRWYGTNTDVQDRRNAEAELQNLQRTLELRVGERTAALTETRVELEMAQRITNTGSWALDLRAGHMTWSDELFRIFRLPVSDVCPQYSAQRALFHPDSWPVLDAAVTAAAESGIPYRIELRLADTAEGARYAVAQCEVARRPDGTVARLYGTIQEVTELVQARLDRDAAIERSTLATAFGGIGIWDWEVDGDTLTWNEQMFRLFDLPNDTTPSYALWRRSIHPDDLSTAERVLEQTLAGRSDFHSTYRVTQRDGSERVIRAAAQLRTDADGRGRRVVGVCLDVTVEALAERIRSSNLTMLREFIRHAPAAIAMLDTEIRYIEASRRWSEMYNLPSGSLAGRRHYDVFPEIPERWKAIHREVLAGAVHSSAEDPFIRGDGQVQYIAWEARPWYLESGAIGGMLFYNQDVTESVELRLRLERQSRELQRSNDDLQQFAYAASHDLQEPLRAVAGFAQILGRRYTGTLDADADTIIGHMTEGASRMRSLIDDLLTFSRVGSSRGKPTAEPLGDLLEKARTTLGHTIDSSGATIESEALPTVTVEAPLIVQLFQNLLGNALKYAGSAPPRIQVSCIGHEDHYEVILRDWGIGVPREAAERVFQIFQRLHTREEYPGTGVGLALCRRIVTCHGGQIWLTQPTDGPGCAVHFTLPKQPSRHASY